MKTPATQCVGVLLAILTVASPVHQLVLDGTIAPVGTAPPPADIEFSPTSLVTSDSIRSAMDSASGQLGWLAQPGKAIDQGGSSGGLVSESGTILRTIGAGLGPYACLMNQHDGDAYITNSGSGDVTIVRGSTSIATVRVGSSPFQCAVDGSTNLVYVLDYSSNSVSIINGTTVQANVSVGSEPDGVTYDEQDGWMYVSNLNSSSVSILSGAALISTVPVGLYPWGIAYDAANRLVYVADAGASSVTVLNGTRVAFNITGLPGQPFHLSYDPFNHFVYATIENVFPGIVVVISDSRVVANLSVGRNPWAPTVDPTNGWAYTASEANDNVSVINGTRLIATIGVGVSPYTPTYDDGNGYIYVPNYGASPWTSPGSVSVISATNVIDTIRVGDAPNGAVYDPIDGWLLVSNGGNGMGTNISAISTILGEGVLSVQANGAPYDSGEVGVPLNLNATLWALGAGGISFNPLVTPSVGLGCTSPIFLAGADMAALALDCVPTTAGTYIVEFAATDSKLGRVVSSSNVTVTTAPVAVVSIPRSVYDIGQVLNVTFRGVGGLGGYEFRWLGLPAGCSLGASNVICPLKTAGTYFVIVEVRDVIGGVGNSTLPNISVFPPPSLANPTFDGEPRVGSLLRFSADEASGAPPLTYTWRFGDGENSSVESPMHAYRDAGEFQVLLAVSDGAGFGANSSLELNITSDQVVSNPTPLPYIGTFGGIVLGAVVVTTVILAALALARRVRSS